jgi:hypothetical protein
MQVILYLAKYNEEKNLWINYEIDQLLNLELKKMKIVFFMRQQTFLIIEVFLGKIRVLIENIIHQLLLRKKVKSIKICLSYFELKQLII